MGTNDVIPLRKNSSFSTRAKDLGQNEVKSETSLGIRLYAVLLGSRADLQVAI